MRRTIQLSVMALLWAGLVLDPRARQATSTWPARMAPNVATISLGAGGVKVYGSDLSGTKNFWCDLTVVDSECDLTLYITANYGPGAYVGTPDMDATYYVHGIPVSGSLNHPYDFTLARSDSDLSTLCNGVHDISVDIQDGAVDDRDDWRYFPMFVHYYVSGNPNGTCTQTPLMSRDSQYELYTTYNIAFTGQGSRVVYVPIATTPVEYPIRTDVFTPWTESPLTADLYQEEMMPHTDQFQSAQMWFETPSSSAQPGLKFGQAMPPKWDETHTGLRQAWGHERFPVRDGGRGVGWTSTYIQGIVREDNNNYVFVETGQGSLRQMEPDGTLTTIVGWVTDPAKNPIYMRETKATVRTNQILRGEWTGCRWGGVGDGFWTPMDVAHDPTDPDVYYVAEGEGNRICKVELGAGTGGVPLVTTFAGSTTAGYVNGTGTAARFNFPSSIASDPICDCLYVLDRNDAIRKITIPGAVVTTLVGRPESQTTAVSGERTYDIIANEGTYPSYAVIQPIADPAGGFSRHQYAATTAETRALEEPTGGDRRAGVWYGVATSFDIRVNFSGGQSHEVSFYFLDWDSSGRDQTVALYDSDGTTLIDSRTVSSFTNGKYLTWNVTGHKIFRFTKNASIEATVAGIFLDPGVSGNSFVGTDTTTQGDWIGVYGADGHNVIGEGVYYPLYGQFDYQEAARTSPYIDYEVSSGQAAAGMRPELNYPFAIRVASDGDVIWSDMGFASIRRMDVSTFETTHITVQEVQFLLPGTFYVGWSWLDVDRWGNSGPLDGVYYGAFQASHCTGQPESHPNEAYCWAPGDGSAEGLFIFNDIDVPDGWGKRDKTDPPHYYWIMQVIPAGGIYLAGGGEHGLTRMRVRKDDDVFLSNYSGTPNYVSAKFWWQAGGTEYSHSFMLKFGSECHNYLGFADCWAIAEEVENDTITDAELITMFEIPDDDMTSDALAEVLQFIRLNAGAPVGEGGGEPEPPVRRLQLPFRIRGTAEWLLSGLAGPAPVWLWF